MISGSCRATSEGSCPEFTRELQMQGSKDQTNATGSARTTPWTHSRFCLMNLRVVETLNFQILEINGACPLAFTNFKNLNCVCLLRGCSKCEMCPYAPEFATM